MSSLKQENAVCVAGVNLVRRWHCSFLSKEKSGMYHATNASVLDGGYTGLRGAKRVLAHRYASNAILKAIEQMRISLEQEDYNLDSVALCCGMDRYQTSRMFRKITGVSPIKFLFALRMDAAKRLLAESDRSVTDICLDVGYSGLGTFISRFKAAVGLPPAEYRQRRRSTGTNLPALIDCMVRLRAEPVSGLRGRLALPEAFSGIVFLGVFDTGLPEGAPSICTVVTQTLDFTISPSMPVDARIFAVAVPWKNLDQTINDPSQALRASMSCRTFLDGGNGRTLLLDIPGPYHPPILTSLPILIDKMLHSATVRLPPAASLEALRMETPHHEDAR
ncbi:MAG: AraC family transcriptional regulator [Burkholderiales bacterium]